MKMADDEEKIAEGETNEGKASDGKNEDYNVASTDDGKKEDLRKNLSSKSHYISTSESMKNAAKTKVDTIIKQVRLVLQGKNDESMKESGDSEEHVESSGPVSEEEMELKFVDALCDSVSFRYPVDCSKKEMSK